MSGHRTPITRSLVALAAAALASAVSGCVPSAEPPVDDWMRPGYCWDTTATKDLKYVGPADTFGNYELYLSNDGTCQGAPLVIGWAIIRAEDDVAAQRRCRELNGGLVGRLEQVELTIPGAPSDAWACRDRTYADPPVD